MINDREKVVHNVHENCCLEFNSTNTKTNTLYAIQLLIVSSLDMSTQIIHATLNIATPLCRCLSQSANTFHIHIIMSCEQSNNSGYNIQHTMITLANSHLHPMPKDPYPYLTMPYFLPLNGMMRHDIMYYVLSDYSHL